MLKKLSSIHLISSSLHSTEGTVPEWQEKEFHSLYISFERYISHFELKYLPYIGIISSYLCIYYGLHKQIDKNIFDLYKYFLSIHDMVLFWEPPRPFCLYSHFDHPNRQKWHSHCVGPSIILHGPITPLSTTAINVVPIPTNWLIVAWSVSITLPSLPCFNHFMSSVLHFSVPSHH